MANKEFKITLPEEVADTLGIDKDSVFETYFYDGEIIVRHIESDTEDIFEDKENGIPEKCVVCPNFCWKCRNCTIDI